MTYSPTEQMALLQLALYSIENRLNQGASESIDKQAYSSSLHETRACFITLKKSGALRGCIGTLEARRPLVEDVATNAIAAAFRDPRFPLLQHEELESVDIGISILEPSEALIFDSQQSLLDMLRPGKDGLILQEGNARATFLPTVWHSLPRAHEFLDQLKVKAGLNADYWSDTVEAWRYTTVSFSAPVAEIRESRESSITAG